MRKTENLCHSLANSSITSCKVQLEIKSLLVTFGLELTFRLPETGTPSEEFWIAGVMQDAHEDICFWMEILG